LRINGSLSAASIYAGADTGPDDLPGTADDVFAAATLSALFVGGNDRSSVIIAGTASFIVGTDTTGLALLKKGRILGVTIRGAVSDDTRILASILPRVAKLGGAQGVTTKNDPALSRMSGILPHHS